MSFVMEKSKVTGNKPRQARLEKPKKRLTAGHGTRRPVRLLESLNVY